MIFRKPEFITFTGADDSTSQFEMAALAQKYPIEWGILLSEKHQGSGRFPSRLKIAEFLRGDRLRLAAHLCGKYSRDVMMGLYVNAGEILGMFGRVQINHMTPNVGAIVDFNKWWKKDCVAQSTGATFPLDTRVSWLHDRSAGAGIVEMCWPRYPKRERLVGYAGGIGPENVLTALKAIDAQGPYWIDMEQRVRTDDRFDLAKCRAVCEAVYG